MDSETRTILVIGAGTMGNGIAHVAAAGGYSTLLHDVSREAIRRGLERIRGNLGKGVEKGMMRREDADAAIARIEAEPDLEAGARRTDFVVKAGKGVYDN